MTTSSLLDYIKRQQTKGTHPLIMENKLLKAGWKADDIEEALQEIKEEKRKQEAASSAARRRGGKTEIKNEISKTISSSKSNQPEYSKTAGYWVRMGAFVVDVLLIPFFIGIFFLFISSLVYLFQQEGIFNTLNYWLIAGTFAYFIIFQWIFAATPGQKLYGLKNINSRTKEDIGFKRATLTNLPYLLLFLIVGEGLWSLIGNEWTYPFVFFLLIIGSLFIASNTKQGIHNRIAKTQVIQTPKVLKGQIFLSSVIFIFISSYISSSMLIDPYEGLPDKSAQSLREMDDFLRGEPEDFQEVLEDTGYQRSSYEVTLSQIDGNIKQTPTDIFKNSEDAVVFISTEMGGGSGFIISPNGLIVTNYHVIETAERVGVETSRGEKYSVDEVIDYSKEQDLAILKIDAENLPTLPIAQPDKIIEPGSNATVIGHPIGIKNSISEGVFSVIRAFNSIRYDQFDAPISSGNSGGPVLNEQGEVIGVTSFTFVLGGDNTNFGVSIQEIFDLDYGNLEAKAF